MGIRMNMKLTVLVCMMVCISSPLLAQQKGQWVPGQAGLNAGVIPDPGLTYANLTINYSASQLNNSYGNPISGVTGTYSFWLNENVIQYVPKHKFLGGYFAPYVSVNVASGDLNASILGLNLNGGGSGLADTYVEPFQLGWHLKWADFNVGYAFVAPTGRYSAGASNNVGSGYWGNFLTSGGTLYLTKNRATSVNLLTAFESHGSRAGANNTSSTPGQAFTDEWGLGQILPLDKNFHKLLQVGLVGYDQWQVSDNGGTLIDGVTPASSLPYYEVHAVGVQTNLILPVHGLAFFFKYYDEYAARSRPEGRTFVFGGAWTYRIPKPREAPNAVTAECSVDGSPVVEGSNQAVTASAKASNIQGLPMNYSWMITSGKVDGTGAQVRWDSTGVGPGTYTIHAKVDDGKGVSASCSSDVMVNPKPSPPPPTMSCLADPSSVQAGGRSTVTATVNDSTGTPLTYTWQANSGQIVGTGASVQFDSSGLGAGDYTVTGRVANGGGGAADCTASVSVQEPPPAPQASKVGSCNFKPGSSKLDNVCKRLLDDAAVRLQNDPKATIVLIGYADPSEKKPDIVSKARGENASQYLSKEKGVAESRMQPRNGAGTAGGGQENYRMDIVFVPDGASY